MRKSINIAVVALLVVCVALVGLSLAGAVKRNFYPPLTGPGDPDTSISPSGFAVVNCPVTKSQNAKTQNVLILQVQVRNLDPNKHYEIWSEGDEIIDDFQPKANGTAHFHINYTAATVPDDGLQSGTEVNVWEYDPEKGTYPALVYTTAHLP